MPNRLAILGNTMFESDAVGRYCRQLCGIILRRGIEVKVFTGFGADELAGVSVNRHLSVFPRGTALATPLIGAFASWVLFGSNDILWFQYPHYHRLIRPIRYLKRRSVFDYHNVTPPELWHQRDGFRMLLDQSIKTLARYASCADFVLTHSEYSKHDLVENHNLPLESITVIPYGVDLRFFSPGMPLASLRKRLGLLNKKVLLFVGRIAPNKRIDVLIDGMRILRERERHDFKLLIVGSPYDEWMEKNRILETINACSLQKNVMIVDGVRSSELPDYYRCADLFVTASLHEGFCLPIAESAACGKPSIVANTTASPETMGPGGLTFKPLDSLDFVEKVHMVLGDKRFYKRLSTKALEWSETYSNERFCERVDGFLDTLTADA